MYKIKKDEIKLTCVVWAMRCESWNFDRSHRIVRLAFLEPYLVFASLVNVTKNMTRTGQDRTDYDWTGGCGYLVSLVLEIKKPIVTGCNRSFNQAIT
jgi:hypothetical protein